MKAMPSRVSPPVYIEKYGRETQTGKKMFLENEDLENRFTAQKRVFESASESAPYFQASKTKGKKALKVVQEEAGIQERPPKKRRKQQQPYHKVVYYYPAPEPEQIEENENEPQMTQSVAHEVHHYANCSANQGAVPRLSSRKQTDRPCSPGSETTQPCYCYHAHQEAGAQTPAQTRARHNSDSRDESETAKQLDFERLDRGLSEAEILQRRREQRVARERQSLSPRYVVVEQRVPPKVVAEGNSEVEQPTEVELAVAQNVNVQYIPVETLQNREYQRHQIYTNAAEEAGDNSGVPEISSVGVLRECAPASPRSLNSSSTTARLSNVTPSNYQQQTRVAQSYQVQMSFEYAR